MKTVPAQAGRKRESPYCLASSIATFRRSSPRSRRENRLCSGPSARPNTPSRRRCLLALWPRRESQLSSRLASRITLRSSLCYGSKACKCSDACTCTTTSSKSKPYRQAAGYDLAQGQEQRPELRDDRKLRQVHLQRAAHEVVHSAEAGLGQKCHARRGVGLNTG